MQFWLQFCMEYHWEHLEQAIQFFAHYCNHKNGLLSMYHETLLLFSFDIQVCNRKHGFKPRIIFPYKAFYFFKQNKNLSSYQYLELVFILYQLFLLCFGILVKSYYRLNLCWEVRMWSVSMIMSITSVVISELIYVCWNKLLPIIWKFNGKLYQLFFLILLKHFVSYSFLQCEASF